MKDFFNKKNISISIQRSGSTFLLTHQSIQPSIGTFLNGESFPKIKPSAARIPEPERHK